MRDLLTKKVFFRYSIEILYDYSVILCKCTWGVGGYRAYAPGTLLLREFLELPNSLYLNPSSLSLSSLLPSLYYA